MRQAWSLPSYYASMTTEEILDLIALGQAARERGAGLWPQVAAGVVDFDPALRYRGAGAAIASPRMRGQR